MNEETKRLIDEVQGIIDDAAAGEKDCNTEPDGIEIRQAAENFRDIMTRNGVDYFLSGKYQPKGDPKPKAIIALHGPQEEILSALGETFYRLATNTKTSPISRLLFQQARYYQGVADGFRYARWILETLVSAQDEDE